MFAGGLFRFESDERLPLLRRLRELERQMAVPAGFEPATHGVEIRSGLNSINDLGESCSIGAAFKHQAGAIPLWGCLPSWTTSRPSLTASSRAGYRNLAFDEQNLMNVLVSAQDCVRSHLGRGAI